MANKVDRFMTDGGPAVYYDDGFRQVVEDHMTYLRTHPKTTLLTLDATKLGTLYKYEADLYGFLSEFGVPRKLHWIVMRMNGYFSPTELEMSLTSLMVPDGTIVEQLVQTHRSTNKMA